MYKLENNKVQILQYLKTWTLNEMINMFRFFKDHIIHFLYIILFWLKV